MLVILNWLYLKETDLSDLRQRKQSIQEKCFSSLTFSECKEQKKIQAKQKKLLLDTQKKGQITR